jgi:hypothetical protein
MTTNSTLGVRVAQRLREQSPGLDVGTLEPLLGGHSGVSEKVQTRDGELVV